MLGPELASGQQGPELGQRGLAQVLVPELAQVTEWGQPVPEEWGRSARDRESGPVSDRPEHSGPEPRRSR